MRVAQAFNKALCAGVNVQVLNFLGCGNSSTTRSLNAAAATVQEAGIQQAVTVPTTAAVASFNGHSLLTGSCSLPHPVIATLDNGGLLEYPRLGCSNEQPKCCPFNPRVGGPLSVCPADYTTTGGACCPSSDLAGQTPCYTTTPLNLDVSTTLNIDQRDKINPTTSGLVRPSALTDGSHPLSRRQNIAPVKIISTHLFTLKYNLQPPDRSLSTGAKVGIAVGAGLGGTLTLFLLAILISRSRRRGHERKLAEASSAVASSGVMSPRSPVSNYPASSYSRAHTAVSERSGAWTSPDRIRLPVSPPPPSVELPSQRSSAMPQQTQTPPPTNISAAKSRPPQELAAVPVSPTDPPVPSVLALTEQRAVTPSAEFETHQYFSPTGGKFS
ncbi:MAG: hypothetical protein Q9191_002363 [Dirinaria sp. TL-2023a]